MYALVTIARLAHYSDTRYLFVTIVAVNKVPQKLKYNSCYLNLVLGTSSQVVKPLENYDRVDPEFN